MDIFDFTVEITREPQPILLANGWSIAFIGNVIVLNATDFDFCNSCLLILSFQLREYIAKTGDPCPFYSALIRFIGGNSDWTIEQYESADFHSFIVAFPQYSVYHFTNLTAKLRERKRYYVEDKFRKIVEKLLMGKPQTIEAVGEKIIGQLLNVQKKIAVSIGDKWKRKVEALRENIGEKDRRINELEEQCREQLGLIEKNREIILRMKEDNGKLCGELEELRKKNKFLLNEKRQTTSLEKKGEKDAIRKLQEEKEELKAFVEGMEETIADKERLEKLSKKSLTEATIELANEKQKNQQLIELNKKTFIKFKELKNQKRQIDLDGVLQWLSSMKGSNTKETLDVVMNATQIMWCSNFGAEMKTSENISNFIECVDIVIACIMSLPLDEITEGMRAIWYDYYNFQKIREKLGENMTKEIYNNVWKYCLLCGEDKMMVAMLPSFFMTIKINCQNIWEFNKFLEKPHIEQNDLMQIFYKK